MSLKSNFLVDYFDPETLSFNFGNHIFITLEMPRYPTRGPFEKSTFCCYFVHLLQRSLSQCTILLTTQLLCIVHLANASQAMQCLKLRFDQISSGNIAVSFLCITLIQRMETGDRAVSVSQRLRVFKPITRYAD